MLDEHGLAAVAASFVANAFLLHAWIPAQVFDIWNGPAWSISAEAFFYVCLPVIVPFVVWPLLKRRWIGRAIGVIMIVEVAVFFALSWVVGRMLLDRNGDVEAAQLIVVRIATLPPIRVAEFTIGCLLAAAFRPAYRAAASGGWAVLERRTGRTTLLAICAALAVAVQWSPPCLGGACGPDATTATSFIELRLFAVYVPLVTVVVAALAWGDSTPARVLRHPILVRLGEASYALYILQWITWLIVNDSAVGPPGFVVAWLAVAVTVGVSLVAHRFIEVPARHWILNRYAQERAARQLDESSTS